MVTKFWSKIKKKLLLALPQHQHTSFLCPDVSDRIAQSFFKELLKKRTVTKSSRLKNEKTERKQKQSTIWKKGRTQRIITKTLVTFFPSSAIGIVDKCAKFGEDILKRYRLFVLSATLTSPVHTVPMGRWK